MTTPARTNGQRPPEEIQAEIERTRGELDRTLSALEERLTPGQLVDQAYGYLRRSGARQYFEHLGESVRRDPIPLALVGIGLAWLMVADRQRPLQPREPSSGGMRETMSHGARRAAESAHAVRDAASQAALRARHQAERARSGYHRLVEEQPLALGAVGLAIGALLGGIAPGSMPDDAPNAADDASSDDRAARAGAAGAGPLDSSGADDPVV
ncbi:MAG: DUF3618 domain-containing protein [Burkholderiaceae bacterium]|nr:DUF3618 domain-containing protein [Burkholderiaceae bacterium]